MAAFLLVNGRLDREGIFTTAIGQGVIDLWEGNNVNMNHTDRYQQLDKVVTILCILVGCLGIIFSILLLRNVLKFKRKQRFWASLKGKKIFLILFHSLFVTTILILIMVAPKSLLGMNWEFIRVWAPTSVSVLLNSVIATIIIYYIFVFWLITTKKVISLDSNNIHK